MRLHNISGREEGAFQMKTMNVGRTGHDML